MSDATISFCIVLVPGVMRCGILWVGFYYEFSTLKLVHLSESNSN